MEETRYRVRKFLFSVLITTKGWTKQPELSIDFDRFGLKAVIGLFLS